MFGFTHIHRLGLMSGPSLSGLVFFSKGSFGGSTSWSLYRASFCSASDKCVVVKVKKHSLPISQSSKPGTWPWRLAQKFRSWNLGSTFKARGDELCGVQETERLACVEGASSNRGQSQVGAVKSAAPLQILRIA